MKRSLRSHDGRPARGPSPTMPVHVHLLVESGIHIIECLNLEELSAAGVKEFLFAAAPMKLRGATGAPIRPCVPEWFIAKRTGPPTGLHGPIA